MISHTALSGKNLIFSWTLIMKDFWWCSYPLNCELSSQLWITVTGYRQHLKLIQVAVVVTSRKSSCLRMKHKFFWTTFKIIVVNITWSDENGSAKPKTHFIIFPNKKKLSEKQNLILQWHKHKLFTNCVYAGHDQWQNEVAEKVIFWESFGAGLTPANSLLFASLIMFVVPYFILIRSQ